MPSKNARLQLWMNYRVRVCLQDSRMLVGSFLAFDRHMNVVLADTEEFRKLKIRHKLPDGKHSTEEKEIKRSMGLVMIRGENVLTLTAEAPPPAKPKAVAGPVAPGTPGSNTLTAGRGVPAGRGMPLAAAAPAPFGLVAPVRGVGGPAPQQMMMMPPHAHAGPPMPLMMMMPPTNSSNAVAPSMPGSNAAAAARNAAASSTGGLAGGPAADAAASAQQQQQRPPSYMCPPGGLLGPFGGPSGVNMNMPRPQ